MIRGRKQPGVSRQNELARKFDHRFNRLLASKPKTPAETERRLREFRADLLKAIGKVNANVEELEKRRRWLRKVSQASIGKPARQQIAKPFTKAELIKLLRARIRLNKLLILEARSRGVKEASQVIGGLGEKIAFDGKTLGDLLKAGPG